MCTPTGVAGTEAQLGDGVTKEEYEGSPPRHFACLRKAICDDLGLDVLIAVDDLSSVVLQSRDRATATEIFYVGLY